MNKYMVLLTLLLLSLALWGCAGGAAAPAMSEAAATSAPAVTPSEATATSAPAAAPTPCDLEPIVVPSLPKVIPGYVQLDETTGLHMTGDVQELDLETWTLEVTGNVATPLSLTYDDLRCMPKIERQCTLICPGFFQDEATWAGTALDHLLELAGAPAVFDGLKLYSADGYYAYVSHQSLVGGGNFLAYEWEGQPVPILHGFPVRAVFPALDGSKWVKWLVKIEVV